MQAVRAVCDRGATVKKIFTVVDRLEGAAENPVKEDIELVATIRFATCLAGEGVLPLSLDFVAIHGTESRVIGR